MVQNWGSDKQIKTYYKQNLFYALCIAQCGSDPSVFLDLTWFPFKIWKWRLAEELAVECLTERIIKLSHPPLFLPIPYLTFKSNLEED